MQNAIRLIDELIRTGVPVVAIATSPGDRASALNRGCSWALPPDAHPNEMAHALRGTLKENRNLIMGDTLDLGPLLIDFGSRRLEWHGQQVALSRQLFELLGVLALHAGQPVAVDALITALCAKRFGTADDVYHSVNGLRKVLNDHGHIRNRRGFGCYHQ